MRKLLLLLFLGVSLTFGKCYTTAECEDSLLEMEKELKKAIEHNFNSINKEIELLNEEYKNEVKELEKELYSAKIRLEAEQLYYEKLSNLENLIKKSIEINGLDITMKVINEEIKREEKK